MKLQTFSHNVFDPHNHHPSKATRSLEDLPTMVRRSAATSTTSSSGATPAQTENTDNIIIGLTVAIPVALAIVVLILLHRRVKRRQRLEDADDKHKSLDFGMDDVVVTRDGSSRQAKLPEMTVTDMTNEGRKRPTKGMSLDMNSPFLIPANVNQSRESFHSIAVSMRDEDDPYRQVRTDSSSVRTSSMPTNPFADDASSISEAPSPAEERSSRLDQRNMNPPTQQRQPPAVEITQPQQSYNPYQPPMPKASIPAVNVNAANDDDDELFLVTPPSPEPQQQSHPVVSKPVVVEPVVTQPAVSQPVVPQIAASHPAAAAASLSIAIPTIVSEPTQEIPEPESNRLSTIQPESNRLSTVQPENRRISVMGLRPLPPDEPAEDPEQRANRIRSFYKEYFDDTKPNPTGYYPQYNPYAEDYTAEYYQEDLPQPPFAQGMGRRAMTPDLSGPRGPRMRSNTASMQSTGHIDNPAFRGPQTMKKPLPPPAALKSLPTPAKLQGDDMVFLNPTDFAPMATYRDNQLGRGPDSPLGTPRPFSPAVRAHTPLLHSFDDLAALPSPHLLRKSGTFTSLDFAPPPRFRNQDGGMGSDAGSIRSNRSGISPAGANALRAGAHRVSRLPQQMVGTKDDFAMALRPTWELRGPSPAST